MAPEISAIPNLINDDPCCDIDDLPQRRQENLELQQLIATSTPPLVIGVHGDWGAGKTSFLHQLQYGLTGKCDQNRGADHLKDKPKPQEHLIAVWFEAWRYQHESLPVVALLHEIRACLSNPTTLAQRIKGITNEASKLTEVTLRGALLSMENVTRHIGFEASKIEAAGEAWESKRYYTPLPTKVIREQLEVAISDLLPKQVTGQPVPRLVIFIDDLDRCDPETAFRLLEGIRIYLNLDNCIFVLGINRREIERAIEKCLPATKSADDNETRLRAQEYLEKLCNNLWPINALDSDSQARLLMMWLPGVGVPESIVELQVKMLKSYLFLPANPRRIKMYCNAFGRLFRTKGKFLSDESAHEINLHVMSVLSCIQQFNPVLYRLIEQEPAFLLSLREYVIAPKKDEHGELVRLTLPYRITLDANGNPLGYNPSYLDTSFGNVLHCQLLIGFTAFPLNNVSIFLR